MKHNGQYWMAAGLLLAAFSYSYSQSPASPAIWRNPSSPYRVKLTLDKAPEATGLNEPDAAWAQFRTGFKAHKQLADFRVVSASGKHMPMDIFQAGPGDAVIIRFATELGQRVYYVYFGNPKAKNPQTQAGKAFAPKRGVFLRAWEYKGGNANNLKNAKKTLEAAQKSGRLLGKSIESRIGGGFLPFSPSTRIVSLWEGWLNIEKEGEYGLGVTSRNASFVSIDGKPVVQDSGWHNPRRRIRRFTSLKLKAGLHSIRVLHVSPWGDPMLMLAWRPPGGKGWSVMMPNIFASLPEAKAGLIEAKNNSPAIDFSISTAGETFLANRYYQRMSLEAQWRGASKGKTIWEWDFGDGQKQRTEKPRVEHVFLRPGMATIRLTGRQPGRVLHMEHRLRVDRDWSNVTQRRIDAPGVHGVIVGNYDFAALNDLANAEAVLLLNRVKRAEQANQALRAFLERKTAGDYAIRLLSPVMDEMFRKQKDPGPLVQAYQRLAGQTRTPKLRAEMLLNAGRAAIEPGDDPQTALRLFQQISKEFAKQKDFSALREAQIGVGDVYYRQGALEKAKAAYEKAGPGGKRAKSFPAIVRGDWARRVEDFLRRKEYDAAEKALADWKNDLPSDQLDGYMTLLKVRLFLATGKTDAGITEAERLVKMSPNSQYAPELLMEIASGYLKQKNVSAAQAAWRRIIREYSESPQMLPAAKALKDSLARP